jgi:hypothetical protein
MLASQILDAAEAVHGRVEVLAWIKCVDGESNDDGNLN